jgi:bifunctional DNA-binding transcriptional regulator/antitoxin component of YhaV-PrlF toxin-antitoxin module
MSRSDQPPGLVETIKSIKIMHVSMPRGPIRITSVRQVAIPAELLRALGLEVGDSVYFRQSDHDPDILEIIPGNVLTRRYEAGAGAEVIERMLKPSTAEDPRRPGESHTQRET